MRVRVARMQSLESKQRWMLGFWTLALPAAFSGLLCLLFPEKRVMLVGLGLVLFLILLFKHARSLLRGE